MVLGLDTNLIADAEATRALSPHRVDAGTLDLPIEWTDPTPSFPSTGAGSRSSTTSAGCQTPPKSLAELVDAKDGPKIVIEDPRTSTPGLGLLVWMRESLRRQGRRGLEEACAEDRDGHARLEEAYGLFLKGEADMVLSYTTSPAYHIAVEHDPNLKAAIFPEGHYLEIEVAGMTKSTKQPELARNFLKFMLSEPFQSAIPEGNWMYPAKMPAGRPAGVVPRPREAAEVALRGAGGGREEPPRLDRRMARRDEQVNARRGALPPCGKGPLAGLKGRPSEALSPRGWAVAHEASPRLRLRLR